MKTVWRIAKYLLGGAVTVVGTVGSESIGSLIGIPGAVIDVLAGLIGLGTVGSVAVAEVPNSSWKPVFIWLGRTISKAGRKKYGEKEWELKEEKLNVGSIGAFVAMMAEGIQEGLDSDDSGEANG